MTYQAIMTKYLSPTNNRGARIKAWCDAGSITISYPYDLSNEQKFYKAARELIEKLGWDKESWSNNGHWYAGGYTNGYVFVFGNEFTALNLRRI